MTVVHDIMLELTQNNSRYGRYVLRGRIPLANHNRDLPCHASAHTTKDLVADPFTCASIDIEAI